MSQLVIHSAHRVDGFGELHDFWLVARNGVIEAVGTGDSWREAAALDASSGEISPTGTTRECFGTHTALTTNGTEITIVGAGGGILTPGFIDLHGHGAGGYAYDDGAEAITKALVVHRAHGTTRAVLSLVTNPLDQLADSLSGIARIAETDPLVLGAHLEGPFLSHAHKGAHNPDYLIEPTPDAVEQLLQAGRGVLRQITLAPELPGALEAIDRIVAAGVIAAVGHTNATSTQARAAFDHGASILTHLYNGMPDIAHREPGPAAAALLDQRITIELILDGVHVHPDVVRLACAYGIGYGRIALITDAMAAAGASDGRYVLGSLDVQVTDGVARLVAPDGALGSIAGSTLTQDVAVRNAVQLVGMLPRDAVAAATTVPARALGLDRPLPNRPGLGVLRPEFVADAVLFNDAWQVQAVWAAGERLR